MNYIKEEYTEYFKQAGSFSLPDFQIAFSLSYLDAKVIIEEYGDRLRYEDGFLYQYVEEAAHQEDDTDNDDEDENDDEDITCALDDLLEEISGYPKKKTMILEYIEKMPSYSESDKTFETFFSSKYPNNTPFKLRFLDEDGVFFTDNGGLKKCIVDMYTENKIETENLDSVIFDLVSSSNLDYKDEEVISDISSATDEDSLSSEILYILQVFEKILRAVDERIRYANMPLEEKLTFNVRFILRDFRRKKADKEEELEDVAMDIIERVVSIDKELTRLKACEYTQRLVEEAANLECSETCVTALKRVVTEFQTASDEEYGLLRKQIFE